MDTRRHLDSGRLKVSSAHRHRHRPRIEVLENRQLLGRDSRHMDRRRRRRPVERPANWSDDLVPGADRDVSIDQSGNPTIQITSGAQAVGSLTSSDLISISAGSLSIGSSSSLTGGLTMTGGSLTATGSGTSSRYRARRRSRRRACTPARHLESARPDELLIQPKHVPGRRHRQRARRLRADQCDAARPLGSTPPTGARSI